MISPLQYNDSPLPDNPHMQINLPTIVSIQPMTGRRKGDCPSILCSLAEKSSAFGQLFSWYFVTFSLKHPVLYFTGKLYIYTYISALSDPKGHTGWTLLQGLLCHMLCTSRQKTASLQTPQIKQTANSPTCIETDR